MAPLVTAPTVVVGSVEEADLHDTGPGHPEQPMRIEAVRQGMVAAGLRDGVSWVPGRPASREELLRVHDSRYLNTLSDFIVGGGRQLDPDTAVSAGSWDAALYSAGSGLEAIALLDRGDADSAFVATRPPGHHATKGAGMGFCLFNNVAVAAAALAERDERVLIFDWDVHHGNGTQDIFWDDPRVMYVSTHEWPNYPGTGRSLETGGLGAPDLTVNIPLPSGATGDVARAAVDRIVLPLAEAFDPTWVLLSAGFDAHRDDPMAGLDWTAGDYPDLLADIIGAVGQPGHIIAFLEGGYDLTALVMSAGATIAALAGQSFRPEAPSSGGPGKDAVVSMWLERTRMRELDRWA